MQTTGEYLKSHRIEKGYSLDQVASLTKIKKEYIEDIEAGRLDSGLSEVYIKGFLKSYANILKLDSNNVLALYRRDKERKAEIKGSNITIKKPLNKTRLLLTPKFVVLVLSAFVITSFLVFFGFQVANLLSGPGLSIDAPEYIALESKLGGDSKDISIDTSAESLSLKGVTDEGSILTINNEKVKYNSEGVFTKEIKLSKGSNLIVIKSNNGFDKYSSITLNVNNTNNN